MSRLVSRHGGEVDFKMIYVAGNMVSTGFVPFSFSSARAEAAYLTQVNGVYI